MTAASGGISPLLAEIDLVIFDKDGTLIAFDAMWGGWAQQVGSSLEAAAGVPIEAHLFAMLGYEPTTGRVLPYGGLAATPMARLRAGARELLLGAGLDGAQADAALDEAWHAPDPVALARPLADLPRVFRRLQDAGCRIAVATTDDRGPTERTLAALGLAELVDGLVCADDGVPVKPAPDMVIALCGRLGIDPARVAVVGDSVADLEMARRAGAGLVVGVLSGVGELGQLASLADVVLQSVADFVLD